MTQNENVEIREYKVEINDREWIVLPKSEYQYIVQYPEKDRSQVVDLDEEHCSGTYFEYNESCPHIEACQEVREQVRVNGENEEEQDQSDGLDIGDAVYCRICNKVHAGQCDFQKSGESQG